MSELTLVIGNKNYSSWSLRPWLLMREMDIPFGEILLPLDTPEFYDTIGTYTGSARVPVLRHGERAIWDSLAIIEYVTELFPDKNIWPEDAGARAYARSCVAEMHSGFTALRGALPMNIRKQFDDFRITEDVAADVSRIVEIWLSCRSTYGANGDFLFGAFSAADAFFAPVVWRFESFGVSVPDEAAAYMDAMKALPGMIEWRDAALAETWIFGADEI